MGIPLTVSLRGVGVFLLLFLLAASRVLGRNVMLHLLLVSDLFLLSLFVPLALILFPELLVLAGQDASLKKGGVDVGSSLGLGISSIKKISDVGPSFNKKKL